MVFGQPHLCRNIRLTTINGHNVALYRHLNKDEESIVMKQLLRLTLTVALLLCSYTLSAQVSFSVDAPSPIAVGEAFRVEFKVDAEPDRNSFTAPGFEGFDVVAGPSVSTGHSVQFINGHQSSSYECTYTYVLIATSAGKHTIGSATVKVKDKEYRTNPLLIEAVTEKKSTAKQGQNPENLVGKDDILLRLKVSETELYKGESMRASLILYTRASIDNIDNVSIPPFDGFWSQELSFDNTPTRVEYNGGVYEAYKLVEMLLSPQQSGTIVIPAAKLTARAQVFVESKRNRNIFFGGHDIYHVTRDLESPPVSIKVKEFPAGAPASFNGAVGSFKLNAKMPSSQIESNSADQIELTISGSGNLKFLSAPRILLPESFEVYDTKVIDNIKVTSNNTSGSITYTYPFVARSPGEFTIEPIEFSYFDPSTGQYHTLATEPTTIRVIDDGSVSTTPVISGGGLTNYATTMRQLDRDIRFIHTGKLAHRAAASFVLSPSYWLIMVLCASIFIVVYLLLRKRIRDNRNIVARRMKRADKVAVQRLRMAERSMKEGRRHDFYEEMLRAMWGYISDKFNIPVSNLTKETIREELYRRNVTATVAESFCDIITRSEEAQYAPSAEGEMDEVYANAIDVISKIEEAVKR